jgi:hypothetical protein
MFAVKNFLKSATWKAQEGLGGTFRIVIDGRINTSAVETLTLFVFLS